MDLALNQEQEAIRDAGRRFAETELRRGQDESGDWFRGAWRKCAEFGVLGAAVPERFGGSASGLLNTMLLMEGLGRGGADRGLLFSLNAQMWSVQHPLLEFGTDEQQRRYVSALRNGDLIGAHGMTEPDSGSDAFSLRTTARRSKNGYVLDGSKTMITNAPIADVFILFANVEPSRGLWGITAFVVDRGTEGLLTGPAVQKLGLQSSPMGEVAMQDCFVAEDARLGPEGAGASVFNSSMEWERGSILAAQLGAMERQFDETATYAKARRQFKTAIGKLPPVRDRMADMRVRLELARLILYKVGWLKDRGDSAELEAAIAKLYLSEAAVCSSLDAMRVFGGYGYMSAIGREAELRDAIGGLFYSGTSDMQRVLIAGLLGL